MARSVLSSPLSSRARRSLPLQLLQREGDRPHGTFVEVRRIAESTSYGTRTFENYAASIRRVEMRAFDKSENLLSSQAPRLAFLMRRILRETLRPVEHLCADAIIRITGSVSASPKHSYDTSILSGPTFTVFYIPAVIFHH